MTDTHCHALLVDAKSTIWPCSRDAGHGHHHWHEDDRGEIIRHWTTPEGSAA